MADDCTTWNDDGPLLLYVGTHTGEEKGDGIYRFRFTPESGALSPAGVVEGVENPMFLTIHPNRHALYAVSENNEIGGKDGGVVTAFAMDDSTGDLQLLNRKSSGAPSPCHVIVDPQKKNVLVANYGRGSVMALPIESDGRLGDASCFLLHEGPAFDSGRQDGPHAHSVTCDSAGRFVFVADLGLDRIFVYRYDAEAGRLFPHDVPEVPVAPGAGPRHVALHSTQRFAYVINELDSTVTGFSFDAGEGTLQEIQTITTLPDEFSEENWPAEVLIHPSGRFLYGSNRGHDSIAIFAIDEQTGRLTTVARRSVGGENPRHFVIDPKGRYLLAANQDSDSIMVFAIDPETGDLVPTGEKVFVPSPVCCKFLEIAGS